MTPSQLSEMSENFKFIDKDNSGTLTLDEFTTVMQRTLTPSGGGGGGGGESNDNNGQASSSDGSGASGDGSGDASGAAARRGGGGDGEPQQGISNEEIALLFTEVRHCIPFHCIIPLHITERRSRCSSPRSDIAFHSIASFHCILQRGDRAALHRGDRVGERH